MREKTLPYYYGLAALLVYILATRNVDYLVDYRLLWKILRRGVSGD